MPRALKAKQIKKFADIREESILKDCMDGSGIMFLNSQIKKEYPNMSINERSKKVSEIWSFMSEKEKEKYGLKGNTEWICDPNRKQIDECTEPCIIKLKSDEHDEESESCGNGFDDAAISLLQFPNNVYLKKRFLQPQNDLINKDKESSSTSANLQLLRQVIAQQLSEQSSKIPLSDSFVIRNVDIDKVKVINERSKQRVKRLRNFAAKGNIHVHVYTCTFIHTLVNVNMSFEYMY
jgi:hypothetical protein